MKNETLITILATLATVPMFNFYYRRWQVFCNSFATWVEGVPWNQWLYMWIAYFAITKLRNRGYVDFKDWENQTYVHLKVRAWTK